MKPRDSKYKIYGYRHALDHYICQIVISFPERSKKMP